MRRGKMGSQLGADQKYYISRCEEKQSIQLTITVVGVDEEHIEERRDLINDIIKLLEDIMNVFTPVAKERPLVLIPCAFCPILHIPLDDACSGKAIFCPNANDKPVPHGYYNDLLQGSSTDSAITAGKTLVIYYHYIYHSLTGVDRKLEIFTTYYEKLTHLDFKVLCPHLVTARIISHEDSYVVQQMIEPSKAALHILGKISASLQGGTDVKFDKFLSVLQNYDDSFYITLAKQIRKDLLKSTKGIA